MMKTTKAAAKAAAFLKQKKYRTEIGEYLVEGLRNVEEAVEYAITKMIFYVPSDDPRLNKLLQRAAEKSIAVSETFEGYMAQISDTATPQGVIGVCKMPKTKLTDVFRPGKMVLVLDRIQDPGNLGTIIRTADAAGIGGIVSLVGTVDAYNPKVVRSAMGSIFHIPLAENVTEAEFLSCALEHRYITVATAMEGGTSIFDARPQDKVALIVGNEANGVSTTLLQSANARYYIPMKGRAESLNVAMAAGIIMFELNK